jgi:hypothetical protein
MMNGSNINFAALRDAMAGFAISQRVDPNEEIPRERVFFPKGHRGVLDFRRQLVIGNRGAGKSFWTHALKNPEVRSALARTYQLPALDRTEVVIGFNGSVSRIGPTASIDDIRQACQSSADPELIWRAVVLRAVRAARGVASDSVAPEENLANTIDRLTARAGAYSEDLSLIDNQEAENETSILVVFDALDRLSHDWGVIRKLTKGLLITALGLQSFRRIRAKVFMRVDQQGDEEIFRFQDSSKIRNDWVDLAWKSEELYGLLIFELMRNGPAALQLEALADRLDARAALPRDGSPSADIDGQKKLINALAGEYMGKGPKRGRVYTWVPLHLSDAANNCSPRTFLTAWRAAAGYPPSEQQLAVNYVGLTHGVRNASTDRLNELKEDYRWIELALNPLRGQHVPMAQADLFTLWRDHRVAQKITAEAERNGQLPPIGLSIDDPETLLEAMIRIAVMEKRTNDKVNLPDIFRVDAGVLRKGGVAVPRRK